MKDMTTTHSVTVDLPAHPYPEDDVPDAPYLPEAVSFIDYVTRPPNPEDTLLGERFLCRKGGMLFVGPSGIGKSSASAQQDFAWSVGKSAFGIKPARPLKILVFQAENDDGDMHEMAAGVTDGLKHWSVADQDLCRENLIVVSERATTGAEFLNGILRPLIAQHRPDLVRIDPLLAYLGGEPTDSAKLTEFCRSILNPIIDDFNCSVILNHHTPKTTNRDTSKWRPHDWMYSASGAAELTNWARAILVIEPTADVGAFKFIAAKRGKRMGWTDELGQAAYIKIFCHSQGSIVWREATPDEADAIRDKKDKNMPKDEELMAHVPVSDVVAKNALLDRWQGLGVSVRKSKAVLERFLDPGSSPMLYQSNQKRSGSRPVLMISRREVGLI